MTEMHELFGIPIGLQFFIVGFCHHGFISYTKINLHCCRKVSFEQFFKRNNPTFLLLLQLKLFNSVSKMKSAVKSLHSTSAFYPKIQNSYTIRGKWKKKKSLQSIRPLCTLHWFAPTDAQSIAMQDIFAFFANMAPGTERWICYEWVLHIIAFK